MYQLVKPDNFTKEHLEYIENFKKMIRMLSDTTDTIMGAKDVDSRHIIATKHFAKIVGLTECDDVTDKFDDDMPCEGTAKHAEEFRHEDKLLLESQDIKSGVMILNVHHYSDGIKARVFKKFLLKHDNSKSILGTIYSAQDINLADNLNLIPNYTAKFGKDVNLESMNNNRKIVNDIALTEYEQEICFLLLFNWDFKQIANFMNNHRPMSQPRTIDTIIKKKNYICNKLCLKSNLLVDLQEFLISIKFHNKIPLSFLRSIAGTNFLRRISV